MDNKKTRPYPEDHVEFIDRTSRFNSQRISFSISIQFKNRELSAELSPQACKVLLYLTSIMYLNNTSRNSVQKTADFIHMNRSRCYKAFKELVEKKVIINIYRRNDPTWLINPTVAFKGTFSNQIAIIKRFNKLVEYGQDKGV